MYAKIQPITTPSRYSAMEVRASLLWLHPLLLHIYILLCQLVVKQYKPISKPVLCNTALFSCDCLFTFRKHSLNLLLILIMNESGGFLPALDRCRNC